MLPLAVHELPIFSPGQSRAVMKIEVTNDASKLKGVCEYLDGLRRSILTNQKQVTIEQTRNGKEMDIKIHINGKIAGAPEENGKNSGGK